MENIHPNPPAEGIKVLSAREIALQRKHEEACSAPSALRKGRRLTAEVPALLVRKVGLLAAAGTTGAGQ